MSRVLVLAGGSDHAHDYPAIGDALVSIVERNGDTVELVDHPDRAAGALDRERWDALVVDALFWRMVGDAYDPWRERWGYSPPEHTRVSLERFVRAGGGLLAMHTTPICFDDWAGWGDVVGGSWRWGTSSHPAAGAVDVMVVADHPVVADVPTRWNLVDEVYGDLDIRPGVDVLATARRTPDDEDQPVIWAHQFGEGRVVFDGFGHDAASILDQNHSAVLTSGLRWVTGRP